MSSRELELQRVAKERIGAGELPCHRYSRMWGSRGSGERCSLCDQAIQPDEVEYEVASATTEADGEVVLRFHLACHAIWQAECVRSGSAPAEAG